MGFCLKTTFRGLLYAVLFGTFLIGCGSEVKRVDTSGINVTIEVERFDQSLLALAKNGISTAEISQLRQQYPLFLPLFLQGVIRIEGPTDSITALGLSSFVLDANIKDIADTVQLGFSDMSATEKVLTDAFKNYAYYFPGKIIPKVVTFYSGFNYAQVADDSLLAIGLDMYLGANSSYYPMLGFPQYRFRNMEANQIPLDALYSWITTEYELQSGGNLLSQMLYYGKMHLALNYLLPDEPRHKSFGFSEDQLAWCMDNEAEIWSFIIDQELMYTNDNSKIRKFIGEGPFTAGFSEEAPAKLGQFIGWRIIQAYMEKNPELKLQQLLEQTETQKILNESNYKPNR